MTSSSMLELEVSHQSKVFLPSKAALSTDVENKLMVTRGERGGINWEIGIDTYTLLYIKQITNKDLLYSTGNSTQYSVMTYMGKESKKEWTYVYV